MEIILYGRKGCKSKICFQSDLNMRYDNINQNEEKDDGKKYGNLV